MNIFNTKKSKEEWQKKIEESYQRGRKDVEDEFLSKKSKIEIDEKDLKKMTEKELLVEIIKSLNMQNKRTDNLNSKISFVMDYKMIFREMNKITNEIYDKEKILCENILKSQAQISEFKCDVANIKTHVQEINRLLSIINSAKSELSNISSEIENIVPKLKKGCNSLENIAENMNDIILKYKDSPVELINRIDKKIGIEDEDIEFKSIISSLEDIENKICDIETKLNSESDDSMSSKISDMEYKVNTALDQYGFQSLYSKINELDMKLDSIESKINNSDLY